MEAEVALVAAVTLSVAVVPGDLLAAAFALRQGLPVAAFEQRLLSRGHTSLAEVSGE